MADPGSVAVVVLNWNGLAMTRECVASLLAQSRPAEEIVVVDNASSGGEADALERELGGAVRVLRSASNLGFAGGVNHALDRLLAERRVEHIALLNNDAAADSAWLEALLGAMREDPRTGAVASKMVLWDRPDRIENAGVWLLSSGDNVPRGRGDAVRRWDRPGDLLAFCGGAVLLRRTLLEQVGTFRADFFANFEDVDLSLRAVAAGWRIRYEPRAVVRHRLNASIGRVRDHAFDVRSVRNSTWAYFVNVPLGLIVVNLPGMLLVNAALVLGLVVTGRARFARAVLQGRARVWRERSLLRAERRRLASRRGAGWLGLWLAQRAWWREAARRGWQWTVRRA